MLCKSATADIVSDSPIGAKTMQVLLLMYLALRLQVDMFASLRTQAKIGQLILNKGKVGAIQVIPEKLDKRHV